MSIIRTENVSYEYRFYSGDESEPQTKKALHDLSFEIEPGQFLAILGHNGSGKSTLARHLNALLVPTEGTVWVDGKDTSDDYEVLNIRQSAGMIFQNPDNQIVASVVEEDVGFGLENLGVPTEEIWKRVGETLERMGMSAYRDSSPNRLSGGQKQRVAIAGVIAMKPKCIIMDEATAMLDPNGRAEVLRAAHELNREEGITIILITHYMEEAVDADMVFLMDKGEIIMQGTPKEIFSRAGEIRELKLDVPAVTRLACELKEAGLDIPDGILTSEELSAAIEKAAPPAGKNAE
ncbi:MAG: energy-coupling factor transporter ATPase [Eubacterium sp.]|nr:energy-coupling factor transporter ATPase [Eubacterium sp.]